MPAFPPDPRVVRLPGVGTRLELRDTASVPVHVVRRNDGHVELHGPRDAVVEFDESNARTFGAFVTGHFVLAPDLSDRIGDVLGGLLFDWVHLERGSMAVGRTIEELAVRRKTGVTIVAILRGSLPIVAPDPSTILAAGDDLVIACRAQDRDVFVDYMTGAA
jgi:TrkA domain protein